MDYQVIKVIEENKSKERKIELVRLSDDRLACVKVMKAKNERQRDKFYREIVQLGRCSSEDRSLKFIDYSSSNNEEGIVVRIITEYCEKGNLNRLLKSKQRRNEFYPDDELISTFKSFISYFSRLQSSGVCHRDIKPENILVTSTNYLKIGDFGSSCIHLNNSSNRTITGSPLYMSPELIIAKNEFKKGGPHRAYYCPFKSDVFSLGLVFLYMTTLTPITNEFRVPFGFSARCSSHLDNSIKNTRIKKLISIMTQELPVNRPDFLTLNSYVEAIFNEYTCEHCWNTIDVNSPRCCNCNIVLHKNCLFGVNNVCYKCNYEFSDMCLRCNTNTKLLSACQHSLCENCGANEECLACRGFPVINTEENKLEVKKVMVGCLTCKQFTLEETNLKVKHCCMSMFCIICKRKAHLQQRICRDATESDTILCRCLRQCKINTDDLFYKCENCYFKCYFCLGGMEVNHLACAEIVRHIT